ncbi:hypothetical protein ACQEV4_26130 [Streptomyces shenzhenensis]|uniref:hypothetical protein n=1 Tax=Streptomyces shenzhenensis TaxID=943815 RepID=UPI003D93F06F
MPDFLIADTEVGRRRFGQAWAVVAGRGQRVRSRCRWPHMSAVWPGSRRVTRTTQDGNHEARKPLWLLTIGWGVLIISVAAAQGLRNMPAVQRFMAGHPGTLISPGTYLGLPWRVDAQHFLDALYGHGAPLRLRNEAQLGFKQVEWPARIEIVARFQASSCRQARGRPG